MVFYPPERDSSANSFSQPNQNPWNSQPPAGNPFGDPFSADPFGSAQPPGMSTPSHVIAATAADGPPATIWAAFGSLIAAAVVHIGSAVMLIVWVYQVEGTARDATTGLLSYDPTGISSQKVGGWADDVTSSVSLFIAAVFVIAAAGYILIAFFVKAGRNGARVTATVLAALSVFEFLAGPTGWLIVTLGIVGVVCMWLKPSSAYFDFKKMVRQRNSNGTPFG